MKLRLSVNVWLFTWLLLLFITPASAAPRQVMHGHVPAVVAHLQPMGNFADTNHLNLAIGLPLRNQETLTRLLREIYDPASPNYRHYLTPEQFAEKFGPTKQDYEEVRAFAEANGLKVTATHPNRMLLDVSGSVADIERVLHVTMRIYQHPTEARKFYAPDREPSLKLAVPTLRISGLDNYSLPRPLYVNKAFQKSGHSFTRNLGTFSNHQVANFPIPFSPSQMATKVHTADEWEMQMSNARSSGSGKFPKPNQNPVPNGTGSGPGGTYAGNDFRAAYVPDSLLTGAGQVVGLLQFDGYNASDIAYYIATNNLPSVTVSNVLLDGVSGLPSGNGGEVEVVLDIEMAISMAPGLSAVIVYEGSDWHDILNRMATDNLAKQLSCSWYSPGAGADPVADQIWQQMAAQGQSFFSASGDYGAYSGLISFPDDSPYITLVGGTTLTTSGPGGARVSETVWNWYNGDASGGGISTQYPIPPWQQGISMTANQGSWTMRNTPDVALTADNVYVRADGSDQDVGGTSCAAPLWAGVAALINQQAVSYGQPTIGFANPALYAIGKEPGNATAFNDIVTGNDVSFSPNVFYAVPGYDLCTGWGTPTGQGMINSLSSPDTLLITPLTEFLSSGRVGGPFTANSQTFSLTNTGNNSLNWTLVNTSHWLNASPAGGTLAPGGAATTVTVGLNSNANLLPMGTYNATIWFTNFNTQVGQRRQFTLAVLTPPAITSQPTDEAVLMGSTATFAVSATGGQPLYYQWQDNGTNLSDGSHIAGSRTSNLIVTNVSPDNVGAYSVIVSNAAGVAISSNALLTIVQSPPVIATQPADQTELPWPFYSSSIAFSVTVWGSTPLFYQWQKNGINLTDGGNISGSVTNTLTVANPTVADAGYYSVIVGNALGSATSSNAVLTVDVPCQITGQSSINVTQRVSNPVAFWVTSSGSPSASYRWLKLGNGWGSPWVLSNSGPGFGSMFIGSSTTNGDGTSTNGDIDTGGKAFGLHAEGGHTITVIRSLVDPIDPGRAQGYLTFNVDTGNVGTNGMAGFALCDANNGSWFTFYCQSNTYYYDIGWGQEGFPLPFSSHGLSVLLQPLQIGLMWVIISDEWGQGSFITGEYGAGLPPDHLVLFNNNAGPSPANDIYFNSFDYMHEHFNGAVTLVRNDDAAQAAYTNGWQSSTDGGTGPITGATNDIYVIPACALTDGGTYQATVENWWGGQMSSTILLSILPSSGPPTNSPVITAQPASQTVSDGATATFSANAGGTMPFSLQWQKNGAGLNDGGNVSGSDTPTLSLTGVQDSDAGAYTVAATYFGGSVTSTPAVLVVNDLPAITQQPVNQINSPRTMALFTVSANGASPLYFQWTKNGAALNNGGNVSGANTRTLALVNVLGPDEGSYGVVVSNTFGTVFSSNATLTVLGLEPVITAQPASRTNNVGSTATFAVSASGTLPLSYQWQKNGFNLADGGNVLGSMTATLTLSNVQDGDAAAYSVIVTNVVGSVTSPIATLTVIDDVVPTIITQPASQTVAVGGTANFSVTASGSPPLNYQWSFNGTNISGATNTLLTLTNVQFSQAGTYAVLVTNALGSVLSSNAVLTVNPPPCAPVPSGLVSWWPAEGNANDIVGVNNGTLVGGASFAAGEVGQAFSFDGVSSYVSIPDSPSLDIFVSSITIEAWIKVNQFDEFPDWNGIVTKGDSSWRLARDGGSSVIGFSTTGLSNEDLAGNKNINDGQWHHVAGVYDGTNKYIYVDGMLDASTPATGSIAQNSYPVCIGENAEAPGHLWNGLIDEVSIYNRALTASEIQLIYAAGSGGKCYAPAAPVILTQPTNQTVFVGGTAGFSIVASGTSPLSYQWNFNGTNLIGATNTTLMLTNVQVSQAGNYTVLVTNVYGSTNSAVAVLTVNPLSTGIPVITGFSPIAGTVGVSVTISGTNFSSTASNNIVYFGGVRAVVNAASVTNLVVTMPAGAIYAPITETVNGLTAYANSPFLPTFPGSGVLSSSSLSGPTSLTAGSGPVRVVIGDLDGDGKSDVIVANNYDATVYIYRNISTNGILGAASFAPPVIFTIGGGLWGLALADLDGDGRLDIVVANYTYNNVSIFQNQCSPGSITTNSFGARVDFPVGPGPTGVAVQDLDGDGKPEIVTANYDGTTVSVLRNIGTMGSITTNSFAPAVSFTVGPTPVDVMIADVDGDGKADIVTVNNGNSSQAMSVLRNLSTLGNISFATNVDFPGLSTSYSLAIGDLDGDGKPDVVIGSLPDGQSVSVYRNVSTPGSITTNSFAAPVDFAAGGWANSVAIGDLDGDGKPDVAVVTQIPDHLSLFKNTSTPGSFTTNSFAARVDFSAGWNPIGVAIGDLDGDGRLDIIFGNTYDGTVSIYQNEVPFGGPPSIASQPTNQTVAVGGTANFSVTASGSLPLSYQWAFNGTNIVGATNTSLTLTNVQLSQAGNYTVLVTNLFGSILSSNAVLMVTLDHFAWNPIPSPRFLNTPFAVVIQARDMTNGLFTNFTGTAILGTTNGVAVAPPVSGNFIQGIWTGSVMVSQTASNLVLRADDGLGHFGLANPITVISLPWLGMLRSGNIALYMWPVGYSGFVLETSGSLSPATWVVVPYSPIQVGDQYLLPLEMTGTNGFYRLWFPGP